LKNVINLGFTDTLWPSHTNFGGYRLRTPIAPQCMTFPRQPLRINK